MMATSMGPNFTGGHPAGMTHPGVASHGMGPGMPHNPGQQGVPGGGMPHQFAGGPMAVSAPGGQVNPAMMSGMPQGANPHAHGLQHLNPAQQQQLLQQQQQQFQNFSHSPNAMAAMRQHQHLMHHQQTRQLMQQQQQAYNNSLQAGGMPMGVQQLNPQQFHQLRQAGRIPGQHPQQALVAQQYALQQQQQAQQQAQQAHQAQQQAQQQQQAGAQQPGQQQQQPQQGQNAGQPGQMSAQAMQSMAQQGQPAAGGAQAQMAGPQAQQGQQGQAAQQAQQGQQGQPARAQTPSQPQSQPQPPGQQQQQTPQQQSSQAGTPAASQQTPAQTPGSTTAQQSQQPPQQGQPQGQPQAQQQVQHQAQGQPQQGQQQQQQPQQNQQQMGHPSVNAAQQFALQNSLLQQQRQRSEGMKGQCLLKLMQFSEHLSGFPGPKGKDDLSYWNAFVERFFAPEGVFRHSLHITDSGEPTDKQYEIAFPAIARYFHTHFGSGVRNMQLILDKGTTDRPLPHDCHFIENSKASMVYWFETGSHLVANGTLRASFNAQQRIELLEFLTSSHEEYVSRKQVIDAAKPAHQWIKEWRNVNSDAKQSPELSKKGKGKQLKSPQSHPPEILDLPESAVNSKGVTAAVHQFLEIVEVMGQMNPLFGYCHANPGMGPYAALEQYVSTNIHQAPAVNGQSGQQNPRTPSFSQFQMGQSPAAANMNLPGSPHVGGSPAPGQMQAPAMQLQQSQQGTSSSGPSANTSPASNKRRRPSGVKAEDDGSGAPTPQMNGIQNRPGKPATPRMNKRAKANP